MALGAFSGTPLAGPRGRTQVNGNNLNAGEWSVDPKADMVDVTSFEDVAVQDGNTYQTNLDGKRSASFSFKMYFDGTAGNDPHISLGIVPGAKLGNTKLFVDKRVNGRCWSFPFAMVVGTPTSARVAGSNAIEVTVNCVSQGYFTPPA